MAQELLPTLGISRPDGEYPKRCSKCGDEIPEGDVPLMLWGKEQPDGHVPMWVYCEACEGPIIAMMLDRSR